MSAKRGRLFVEEKLYEKAIHPPTPQEIMKPDDSLRKLADEIDMVRGKDNNTSQSKFIAYAAAVQDLQDIQAAYTKVRIKYADATHVVCAYRLNGKEVHNMQDYADDGEFGAGRTILNLLKSERIMNVVVFLIRYYGGKNLGPIRFDIFREVAMSSIDNLRKRVEEMKQLQQEEQKQKEQQHQQQMQQQKQNPAFPQPSEHEWQAPMEDWSQDEKKSK